MSWLSKLKPKFWDYHDVASGPHTLLFSFRRKWKLIVLLTSIVTMTPLIIMTFVDYRLTRKTMEAELVQRTSRLVSNTWRSVSFFLTERRSAMAFILQDNPLHQLSDPERLAGILDSLQKGIGGFVDIGVVDAKGALIAYAGPYLKQGMNLCNERCFKKVVARGAYISSLEVNGTKLPRQIVMAIKHPLPDRRFFVLRASLDAMPLYRLLAQLDIGERDDAFLIDRQGNLQTPSRFRGGPLSAIDLPIPASVSGTDVVNVSGPHGGRMIMGHARIPGTDFTLVVLRDRSELMQLWYRPRIELVGFLILGIAIIVMAILGMATFLVHRIHTADQRRVNELHRVEYANKLMSIERLAAGLAHEINNPLAVINEKAGLIRDLFQIRQQYAADEKLIGLLKSIMAAVDRCGTITRRLLNFSRHMDVTVQPVDLNNIIQGMVDFISREAESLGIRIQVHIPEDFPAIESDRSHLQQIFLNIVSNSYAAMKDGGRLEITGRVVGPDAVSIAIADSGKGISEEDLPHVFEPFFTAESGSGGTGLGLSITHGLVQRIGGRIHVQSKLGEGTRFTLTLPLRFTEMTERAEDRESDNLQAHRKGT